MKHRQAFEIEPREDSSAPWRLVVEPCGAAGIEFNLHWGNKAEPTHVFAVSAADWQRIVEVQENARKGV